MTAAHCACVQGMNGWHASDCAGTREELGPPASGVWWLGRPEPKSEREAARSVDQLEAP